MIIHGQLKDYSNLSEDEKTQYISILSQCQKFTWSFFNAKATSIKKNLKRGDKKLFTEGLAKQFFKSPFIRIILASLKTEELSSLNKKLASELLGDQLLKTAKNGDIESKQLAALFVSEPNKKDLVLRYLQTQGFDVEITENDTEVASWEKEKKTLLEKVELLGRENEKLKQEKANSTRSSISPKRFDDKELLAKHQAEVSELQKQRDEYKNKLTEAQKKIDELTEEANLNRIDAEDETLTERDLLDKSRILDDLQKRPLIGTVNENKFKPWDKYVVVSPLTPILVDADARSHEFVREDVDYRGDYSTSLLFLQEQARIFLDEREADDFRFMSDAERYQCVADAFAQKIFFYNIELSSIPGKTKKVLNAVIKTKPMSVPGGAELYSNMTFVPRFKGTEKELLSVLADRQPLTLENYPTSIFRVLRYIFVGKNIYEIDYTRSNDENDGGYLWKCSAFGQERPYRKIQIKIDQDLTDWYCLTPDGSGLYVNEARLKTEPEEFDEKSFIQKVKENAKSADLFYEEEDITAFHIAIKSSKLVILAGPSGIGKTQLPLLYTKMLGVSESQDTLLFVPVSPSFLEPEDVLGYVRPATIACGDGISLPSTDTSVPSTDNQETPIYSGEFIESQTGLVSFLKNAEARKDKIHVVVFDEMNLAQIEHWFSPFLSLLEKPEDSRTLHLYADKLTLKNSDEYPSSISIGPNVFFIGTINMDETTKQISDRLMDRAVIINLSAPSFKKLNEMDEGSTVETARETPFFKYATSIKNVGNPAKFFTEEEFTLIDEINRVLMDSAYNKGISFRSFKKLATFVANSDGLMERRDAFDYALSEIVLRKVSGTSEELHEVFTDGEGGLLGILEKYRGSNELSKTKQTIEKKKRELSGNGFTR